MLQWGSRPPACVLIGSCPCACVLMFSALRRASLRCPLPAYPTPFLSHSRCRLSFFPTICCPRPSLALFLSGSSICASSPSTVPLSLASFVPRRGRGGCSLCSFQRKNCCAERGSNPHPPACNAGALTPKLSAMVLTVACPVLLVFPPSLAGSIEYWCSHTLRSLCPPCPLPTSLTVPGPSATTPRAPASTTLVPLALSSRGLSPKN